MIDDKPNPAIRFIRYGYDAYYPGGLEYDVLGRFATWEDAARGKLVYDREGIYDTWTGRTWYPVAKSPLSYPDRFDKNIFNEPEWARR